MPDFEEILAVTAASLTARLALDQVCEAILDAVTGIVAARTSWILLYDRVTRELVACAARGPSTQAYTGARIPAGDGIVGEAFSRQQVVFVPDAQRETRWFDVERVRAIIRGSVLAIPLTHEKEGIGVLGVESPRFTAATPPSDTDLRRLRAIGALAGIGVRNAQLFEALEAERSRLERVVRERRELRDAVEYLRSEVREAHAQTAIVGSSPALRRVLSQVELVAPADSTVLLAGETGTGKELIARAIHARSRRASAPFVAVNCAALPDTLVESELFGHEKGAFTGAVARKAGKFELASRGTLFLDEIGDMPPAAQAKLLRVLQEREVQRLGGTSPIPVNVRLIAATNQDLTVAMEEGRFRADLYYRLSVFPLRLPPLRDRRADIPALVAHFATRFATRQHTSVPRFTPEALASLVAYEWPGNVRELQSVVERAVILARGRDVAPDLLTFPSTAAVTPGPGTSPSPRTRQVRPGGDRTDAIVPLRESERQVILAALQASGWRISGNDGAARLLGLKPTTLHAKMKKLGIRRPAPAQAVSNS